MAPINNSEIAGELRPTLTRLYLAMRRRAPITGLSAAQASALGTIAHHGPLRMGAFAEREGIRMPTATTLVDGLIRLGLANRAPDPDDGRAVIVELTEQGHHVIAETGRIRGDALIDAINQLPDDQQQLIAAAVPALVQLQHRLEELPTSSE